MMNLGFIDCATPFRGLCNVSLLSLQVDETDMPDLLKALQHIFPCKSESGARSWIAIIQASSFHCILIPQRSRPVYRFAFKIFLSYQDKKAAI